MKIQMNKRIAAQQKNLFVGIIGVVMVVVFGFLVFSDSDTPKSKHKDSAPNLAGIIDDDFQASANQSAIEKQRSELDTTKGSLSKLNDILGLIQKSLEQTQQSVTQLASQQLMMKEEMNHRINVLAQKPLHQSREAQLQAATKLRHNGITVASIAPVMIQTASFNYHPATRQARKNANNYVPTGTFARAVVLGGADANASVNSTQDQGAMLFKFLDNGQLPNGKRSHLKGCFLTGSAVGDISSERAYVALQRLSCAQDGLPIIDKKVYGWAFFSGKVGIKGVPMMRNGQVLKWAGISGALSGFASAAQYSQTTQSISPLGNTNTVPGGKVFQYGALGGASTAMDRLANYYIKRADQYHPVIQVGSGSVVTIVFRKGFWLDEEQTKEEHLDAKALQAKANEIQIPQQIVEQMRHAKMGQTLQQGAAL